MENGKKEYLQMIQEPISRMSTASAIFKGFAAASVSGILTSSNSDVIIISLACIPIVLFAVIDIYYLRLERKFRFLYKQVQSGKQPIDYSMTLTTDNRAAQSGILDCVKSPSIWLFYPAMIMILAIAIVHKS